MHSDVSKFVVLGLRLDDFTSPFALSSAPGCVSSVGPRRASDTYQCPCRTCLPSIQILSTHGLCRIDILAFCLPDGAQAVSASIRLLNDFETTPGLARIETLGATQPRASQTPHKKGVQPAHCGIPDAVDAAPIEYHGPLEHAAPAVQRPDLPRSAGTL